MLSVREVCVLRATVLLCFVDVMIGDNAAIVRSRNAHLASGCTVIAAENKNNDSSIPKEVGGDCKLNRSVWN